MDIELDMGLREYRLGQGGVLYLNPTDPGLYARFLQAEEKLRGLFQESTTGDFLESLQQLDGRIKELFNWVFGETNDLHGILRGVSLFSRGENGKFLLENLLEALGPVLTQGAKDCAREQAILAKKQRDEKYGSVAAS